MTKWLRLKGRPSCQSLCWRSHLESVAQDCVQMTLEYSPGWRLSNLSAQPTCQCAAALTNPKCILMFEGSFRERVSVKGQQRAMWPCLPAKHTRNLLRSSQRPSLCDHWQEPASVLFAPFRQVFLNSHEIPLNLLSGLRSSNSISLQVKCSTPFNSLRAIFQMHFSSPMLRSSEPHTRLYKPHLCPSARI